MLNNVCTHCQQTYSLRDVRVDAYWNSWSSKPAYCHCPYCDLILEGVYPDTVDLARHLKFSYLLISVCFFLLFGLGVATDTLGYVAPLTLLLLGAWLAKSAQLKDHRIIGWILVALSAIVFLIAYTGLMSRFAHG